MMIAPKTADQKPGVPGPRGRQADRRDETAGRRDLAFSTAAPRFEDGTRWAHVRPGPPPLAFSPVPRFALTDIVV